MKTTANITVADPVYTPSEAAGILKVKVATLKDWRVRGVGPYYIRSGPKFIRYRQSDIDAWLDGQRVERSDADCKFLS